MVGVGGKENEFENQELETTGDDVWGWNGWWQWWCQQAGSALVPLEARDLWENISCSRFEQDKLHHPQQSRAPAGDGTWLWMAELWQKPTLGHVQAVMGEGTQGISKLTSHNPPVLVYLLLQRSKAKNLVSIILFPVWETSQLGLCLICVLHVCPGFGFPFGKGRDSKYRTCSRNVIFHWSLCGFRLFPVIILYWEENSSCFQSTDWP